MLIIHSFGKYIKQRFRRVLRLVARMRSLEHQIDLEAQLGPIQRSVPQLPVSREVQEVAPRQSSSEPHVSPPNVERKHNKKVRFASPKQPDLSPKQKRRIRKAAAATGSKKPGSSCSGSRPKKQPQKKGSHRPRHENLSDPVAGPSNLRRAPHSSSSDDDKPEKPQPKSESSSSSSDDDKPKRSRPKMPQPTKPQPRSKSPRPVSAFQLRQAFEWFHIVRHMVLEEGMDDYDLSHYCPHGSILFMVSRGWIELGEVLEWRHARERLGNELVDRMLGTNGLDWISNPEMPGTPAPLPDSAAALFRGPWQVCRDPTKRYSWKKDQIARRRYGLFGEQVARYATPRDQQAVLNELSRPNSDFDEVNLPGNWRPLFGPLFRRRRISRPGPVPQFEPQPQADVRDGRRPRVVSEAPDAVHEEEEENAKRKHRTTVEDADDDDDDDSTQQGKRLRWEDKGKWRARSPESTGRRAAEIPVPYQHAAGGLEPLASSLTLEGAVAAEGNLHSSNSASSSIEHPSPSQHYQVWPSYPDVANQFASQEAHADPPADLSMEDVVVNVEPVHPGGPDQQAIVDEIQEDMSFELTGPLQEEVQVFPTPAWSGTGNVGMAPPLPTLDAMSDEMDGVSGWPTQAQGQSFQPPQETQTGPHQYSDANMQRPSVQPSLQQAGLSQDIVQDVAAGAQMQGQLQAGPAAQTPGNAAPRPPTLTQIMLRNKALRRRMAGGLPTLPPLPPPTPPQ